MFILSRRLRYQAIKSIDEGSQGTVHQVLDRESGHIYAIKSYAHLNQSGIHRAFDVEVDCLSQLANVPGVLHLHDHWRTYDRGYLVTELCRSSLDPVLYGKLAPTEVKEVGRFLARTLSAMHSRGFQHSDIKPANVLRTEATPDNPEVYRLCDFGLAFNTQRTPLLCDFRGTVDYIAPECVHSNNTAPILGKSDLWSFGVTLFELYSGESPFYRDSISDTLQDITTKTPPFGRIRDVILVDLLRRVLIKDPVARPSFEQLKNHPYLCL